MNELYYTPESSEFYVGFEYEYFNTFSNKYEKEIVTVEDIVERPIFEGIELNKKQYSLLRVKLLDREDIESFGFKDPIYFEDKDFFGFINGKVTLYLLPIAHGILISKIDEVGLEWDLFRGDIKNKSELKKLLVQLGI